MMRLFTALLGCILGTGLLFAAAPTQARADAGARTATISAPADAAATSAAATAQPGTDQEAAEYARREESSPQVQEFKGGAIVIGIVALALIVILVVLLVD